MKKFKLLSTILFIAVLSSMFTLPTLAVEEPTPEANAVMLVDIATGNMLYEKNADTQVYPASLTKIMTVMLALEAVERGEVSLNDSVTASANITYDLIDDGSTAGIVEGETMPFKDLLYCAMVKSANEACNIIAEHVSGNIPSFIALMNSRAAELGCTGTNFSNTHGLPSSSHYTTARDFSIISMAAVTNTMFMDYCNKPSVTIGATNKSEARELVNTNGLINNDAVPYGGYYYEYAAGVKTGHTDAAGYCLVSTAKKNGMNLLCVVMGGKATQSGENTSYGSFTDTINLYNWAFENYSYRDILKITDLVKDVPVKMGSEADFVSVHPQSAVRALLPNDEDLQNFIQDITIYSEESGEELVAPIDAGEVLGEIRIERDGVVYGTSPLVASTSIGLSYSQFISARIGETLKKPLVIIFILVVLALVAGYIFLVVRYRRSRKQYLLEQQGRQDNRKSGVERRTARPAAAHAAVSPQAVSQPAKYFDTPSEETNDKTIVSEEQAERDYFEEFFGKK